mmetsp:Transcript_95942/g.280432  ORF Transcript_95942/g.280432 Transcript_95942/m.280432 type:complete len:220 (-) Transcript_95942:384-1043(-)
MTSRPSPRGRTSATTTSTTTASSPSTSSARGGATTSTTCGPSSPRTCRRLLRRGRPRHTARAQLGPSSRSHWHGSHRSCSQRSSCHRHHRRRQAWAPARSRQTPGQGHARCRQTPSGRPQASPRGCPRSRLLQTTPSALGSPLLRLRLASPSWEVSSPPKADRCLRKPVLQEGEEKEEEVKTMIQRCACPLRRALRSPLTTALRTLASGGARRSMATGC